MLSRAPTIARKPLPVGFHTASIACLALRASFKSFRLSLTVFRSFWIRAAASCGVSRCTHDTDPPSSLNCSYSSRSAGSPPSRPYSKAATLRNALPSFILSLNALSKPGASAPRFSAADCRSRKTFGTKKSGFAVVNERDSMRVRLLEICRSEFICCGFRFFAAFANRGSSMRR